MDITHIGHSCFKIKAKNGTVVTDPFEDGIGLEMPKISADMVTVSHDHSDHNNVSAISGTARRKSPFVVDAPGEYEVNTISVFGISSYHDDQKGELRGKNIIYSIIADEISIVHLGDIGHTLSSSQVSELNGVDILMCPIGGVYTIDPKKVSELINQIEPSIFIPMHYKTAQHNQETFGEMIEVDGFVSELGSKITTTDKLSITKSQIPEEMEVVVFKNS